MLAKIHRISQKTDFEKVFKNGKKTSSQDFIIRFMENGLENCRFSVIVSNKISKKATERNKLRRRIKAVISKNLSKFRKNNDIIIITLDHSKKLQFGELAENLSQLFIKGKLL